MAHNFTKYKSGKTSGAAFGSVAIDEDDESDLGLDVEPKAAPPAVVSTLKLKPLAEGTMLKEALKYAKLGYRVHPLHYVTARGACSCGGSKDCSANSVGKHPATRFGHSDATLDPTKIKAMWADRPRFNIGISNAASGIATIDVDARNGGLETLANLEAMHGKITSNVIADTGGGGLHIVYSVPKGIKLPGKLGPGIEIKHNGYIVGAPSNHRSGKRYVWRNGGPFNSDVQALGIDRLPQWIADLGHDQPLGQSDGQATANVEADISLADVADMLLFVTAEDQDDHDEWLKIGMAIHAQTCGSAVGMKLFDDWSKLDAGRYDAGIITKKWVSFGDKPGAVTIKTLIKLARQKGWRRTSEIDAAIGGDYAHARRFAKDHGAFLRYVRGVASWYRYTGNNWTTEGALVAAEAAMETVAKAMFCEASDALREATIAAASDTDGAKLDTVKAMFADAKSFFKSVQSRQNALKAATMLPELQVEIGKFDADPMMLGVRNGVLNLATGKLKAAHPDMYISRVASCSFDPKARCPTFLQFLSKIQPDADVRDFIRRAIGYTLTGLVDEEKLFFATGVGRNGKSVLANIVAALLGDYAVTLTPAVLMKSAALNSEVQRAITRLPGARIALLNETPTDAVWDDATIKMLASRERIAGRRLYAEAFDFFPTHKLWVRGNSTPGAQDASDGFWRRLVSIPFRTQIAADEIVPDLDRKIIADELPGILAWALTGVASWRRDGLRVPASIEAENRKYRESTDIVAQWLEDCCEVDPSAVVTSASAHRSFETYCHRHGIRKVLHPMHFGRQLIAKGFESRRTTKSRQFTGFRLTEFDLAVDDND